MIDAGRSSAFWLNRAALIQSVYYIPTWRRALVHIKSLLVNLSMMDEKLEAFQHLIETVGCERADLLRQIALIHRENLGDVDNAFLGQACFPFVQEHIARSLGSLEI